MKLGLLLLAVALLSTGCAVDEPGTLPTLAPLTTPTATPTPTPTATATTPADDVESGPPALSTLILSPEGLGPLVIGNAPPSGDPAHDILIYSTTVCQWAVDLGYIDNAAMWVANYEPALLGRSVDPFGVWVEDGKIRMLAVYNDSIETAEGVHLGSSAAEVAAALGSRLEVATGLGPYAGGDTNLYRVAGETSDLYIAILRAESVDDYPEIGAEVVVRLTVVSKGDKPLAFNSDVALGTCVSA